MPRPPTIYQRVESDDESKPTHSQYNINYRQVAAQTSVAAPLYGQPVTSSSSYDYWWPYPPGGVTTSSSPSPSPVIPPTLTDPFSIAVLSSLSSVASSSSIIPDSNSALTSSSTPISTSTPSPSALQSIILINATMSSQTTASTFSSYPKNAEPQSSNSSKSEAYLIPIFVVLGVVLGSVIAWIGWGCITRKPRIRDFDEDNVLNKTKHRHRRSELEVGPAYCSSLSERTDLLAESDHTHEKEALAPQSMMFTWRTPDANADGGKNEDLDRNLLAPPKLPPKNPRSKTVGRSKRQQALSRATTSKTATSVSIYSQVGEEDETHDDDLTERMSFLDDFESNYDARSPRFGEDSTPNALNSASSARVVSLSRRRPNHTRTESDYRLEDAETPVGRNVKKNILSRSTTARTQSSTRTAQTGFRMIEGSPLPTPALSISGLSQIGGGFFWGNNEPESCVTPSRSKSRGRPTSNVNARPSDSYTALPARGARSRSNSPIKQTTRQTTGQRRVSIRDRAIEEYYGSSLPQSPPQVVCPKLESSLCFTPTMN
ncbi:hypothetical protein DFH05DRAFT_918957 [Lentinula detonsa]|uniref:Uncharacterized protein n=1 Tax=Lentinula detonsa TaxID=2804962 RepID=A0A9W8TYZ5_9AGAR|nr:hypothetical protein DFH05DRAFT_918957 [Lentinula detonsa]